MTQQNGIKVSELCRVGKNDPIMNYPIMNYVSFSLFLIMRLFSWILQLFFATVAFLRHLTLF